MIRIVLTPREALGYRLSGDTPDNEIENTIEIVLAVGNVDEATLRFLVPIYAEAARSARAKIREARRFEIVTEGQEDTAIEAPRDNTDEIPDIPPPSELPNFD